MGSEVRVGPNTTWKLQIHLENRPPPLLVTENFGESFCCYKMILGKLGSRLGVLSLNKNI